MAEPQKSAVIETAGISAVPKDVGEDLEGRSNSQPQIEDFDVETVERVYRKLDLRIIPGTSFFASLVCPPMSILTSCPSSLLGPVLLVFCHPFQHWHCPDYEQTAGP